MIVAMHATRDTTLHQAWWQVQDKPLRMLMRFAHATGAMEDRLMEILARTAWLVIRATSLMGDMIMMHATFVRLESIREAMRRGTATTAQLESIWMRFMIHRPPILIAWIASRLTSRLRPAPVTEQATHRRATVPLGTITWTMIHVFCVLRGDTRVTQVITSVTPASLEGTWSISIQDRLIIPYAQTVQSGDTTKAPLTHGM